MFDAGLSESNDYLIFKSIRIQIASFQYSSNNSLAFHFFNSLH